MDIGTTKPAPSPAANLFTEQVEQRQGAPLARGKRPITTGVTAPEQVPVSTSPIPLQAPVGAGVNVQPDIESQLERQPAKPLEIGQRFNLQTPPEAAERYVSGVGGYPKIFGGLKKVAQNVRLPAAITDETTAGMVSGLNQAVEGGMEAATPAMIAAGLVDPIGTAKGLGGYTVASKVGEKAAQAAGADPETQQLVGTAAGLLGGGLLHEATGGKPYKALPTEPAARASELFRNLAYKGGADLPENFTPEQASQAFRHASQNFRDPANPANDSAYVKDLNAAYSDLKQQMPESAAAPVPKPAQTPSAPPQLAGQTEAVPAPESPAVAPEAPNVGEGMAKAPEASVEPEKPVVEDPKVAGEHVGYATDGKPIYNMAQIPQKEGVSLQESTANGVKPVAPESAKAPELHENVQAKQPWEMTQDEYLANHLADHGATRATQYDDELARSSRAKGAHYDSVAAAVKQGHPVPSSVLADYPDLQKTSAAAPKGGEGQALAIAHGTSAQNIPGILRDGLKSQDRIDNGATKNFDKQIYFASPDAAQDYAIRRVGDKGNAAIVYIKPEYAENLRKNADKLSGTDFYTSEADVPPSAISHVEEWTVKGNQLDKLVKDHLPQAKGGVRATIIDRNADKVNYNERKPASSPVKGEQQPWEMTKAEAQKKFGKVGTPASDQFTHEERVAQAVKDGKPVPASVLADYPDLAAKSESPAVLGEGPQPLTLPAETPAKPVASEQGRTFTDLLQQPSQNISGATGEMERNSPLFHDSEASGQTGLFGEAKDHEARAHFPTVLRSSVFGVDIAAEAAGKAVKGLFEQDIAPTLKKLGINLGTALQQLRELITPRAGVSPETLDSVMKLTGEREKRRWILDQVLQGAEKMMGRLPQAGQVAFIDRVKQGQKQPNSTLQAVADFISKTDSDTYRRVVDAQVRSYDPALWEEFQHEGREVYRRFLENLERGTEQPTKKLQELASNVLDYKKNHYRVLWKVVPGTGKRGGAGLSKGNAPLQGSQGFARPSTLATMSEGVEAGGVPYDYNPVTMFKRSQADSERYITAQNMWSDALEQDARVFVKPGPRPEGFTKVEDRIGDVRFPASSGEGSIDAGNWYLRDDYARLMNNFLSRDRIREHALGRGVLAAKNKLTQYRLSLSPFHAFTTSFSAIGSQVGTGFQDMVDAARGQGIKSAGKGLLGILTSPSAPFFRYREGSDMVHYVANKDAFLQTSRGQAFVQRYPEFDQMLDRIFASGARLGLHEDEATHSVEALRRAWANADIKNNPLGAVLRLAYHSPFALNQLLFRPLFNYFIPRVKLAAMARGYSRALVDHADDLTAGHISEGQLGRQVWDMNEDIFGQVNWDKFFWNRTFKTSNQILFRAAQFAAGNARLTDNAFSGQAQEFAESARYIASKLDPEHGYQYRASTKVIPRLDPRMGTVLGILATFVAANTALQYYMTRELPKDAKDLFAARIGGVDSHGKPRRVSAPAIVFKDALSLYFNGAVKYLTAKESDLVGGLIDILGNHDFQNDLVHNPEDPWLKQRGQDVKHMLGLPIGVSNALQGKQSGETVGQSALGLLGFAKSPRNVDWSPAEEKSYNYVRMHQGTKTPEQMDELQDYMERKASGQLMPKEQKSANKSARESFLHHNFKNREITLNEALDIWSVMSPEEKQQNYRELVHRSNTEIKKLPYAQQPAMRQKVNEALTPKQTGVPAFLQRLSATHNQ